MSTLSLVERAFTNSTAERESSPLDISGTFVSISAPVTSWATLIIALRMSFVVLVFSLVLILCYGTLTFDAVGVAVAA